MAKMQVLIEHEVDSNEQQFWNIIDILNNRSHLVNRHLIGTEILLQIEFNNLQIRELINQLKSINCLNLDCNSTSLEKLINLKSDQPSNNAKISTAYVKRLFPKSSSQKPRLEVTVCDYVENSATFYPVSKEDDACLKSISPNFEYCVALNGSKLTLLIDKNVLPNNPSCKWLASHVFPKLLKWIENTDGATNHVSSLSLVPIQQYFSLYQKLKHDYGKKIVEMWTEVTDPLKFVYEDIAIATYLLLLWGNKKQMFVDLGCGNGLLVYILTSEGHHGIGYDLKARKIWKMFPCADNLKVKCIIPSTETLFPEADWLIGNHSDELTLWIPVIASRSSFKCKFFVLPCCPYKFDGRKYQRLNTSVSQYNDYLNYVETVCIKCGFKTQKDKLRIPSTRRICFIGSARTYEETDMEKYNDEVNKFITSKSIYTNESKEQCVQFVPRSEERVRNCTQVGRDLIDSIVKIVTAQLLTKKRYDEGSQWNKGGILDISSVAKLIAPDDLKKLKNECGGLQTLLKNNHQIFKVECGKVELRKPVEKKKSDQNWKIKPCWFFQNHPDSCPVSDEMCSFKH